MPNSRVGVAARPPARRPARRPSPRTIRRRRAFAIVMLAVTVLSVYALWPKPSRHGNVSVAKHGPPASAASRATVVVHVTAAAVGWRLGSPLSRAAAFSDGTGILLAGGLDSAQNTVSAVQRIDPGRGATTPSGSLTVPVHDAAGATIGARHFLFGGGAQHVSDVVQTLEPNRASTVVGHLPQPRADLAAVTIGSTAYLIGGYDGTNATRDVLATSDGAVFRTVAQLPFGVRYPAVAALGNQVYVFGGELGGTESDSVQQIDVSTGTARIVAQLPSPRTEATAVTVSGRIYVVGGLAGGVASSDVIAFDPTTNRWSFDGQLPTPVADSAVVNVGARSFLLGGEAAYVSPQVTVLQTTTSAAAPITSVRPFAGRLLIADRGNNRLIVVDVDKRRSWIYPSSSKPPPAGGFYFPDDAFFADHGRSIVTNQEENHTIVRIAFPSGALQWTYGHPKIAGTTAGFLNQPDDAFLLRDGTYVVADALNCRILHISATGQPLTQIGTTGNCVHDPPRSVGYPNGDTPLADGNLLISEIHGSWISEYTPAGALVWTVHLPITYPSDPQQIGPDLYLVSDYAKPGGILEFTREGRIVWTYRPTSGERMLDHPSLAERLPNGLIGVNDDYRHRVVFIDPTTETIVWQYGQTDRPGTGIDELNTPDGFDVLLPDSSTPLHSQTG